MARRTEAELLQDIAIPQALEKLREKINKRMAKLTDKYPDTERLFWPQMAAEAQAHSANSNAVTPMLTAAATEAGVTVDVFAADVLDNAATMAAAAGKLAGLRRKGGRKIKNCTTLEQLEAVMVDLGIA